MLKHDLTILNIQSEDEIKEAMEIAKRYKKEGDNFHDSKNVEKAEVPYALAFKQSYELLKSKIMFIASDELKFAQLTAESIFDYVYTVNKLNENASEVKSSLNIEELDKALADLNVINEKQQKTITKKSVRNKDAFINSFKIMENELNYYKEMNKKNASSVPELKHKEDSDVIMEKSDFTNSSPILEKLGNITIVMPEIDKEILNKLAEEKDKEYPLFETLFREMKAIKNNSYRQIMEGRTDLSEFNSLEPEQSAAMSVVADAEHDAAFYCVTPKKNARKAENDLNIDPKKAHIAKEELETKPGKWQQNVTERCVTRSMDKGKSRQY